MIAQVQRNLFGEPEQRAEASQWWTPMWFALRMAAWVPRTAHVIEPACGGGNLIKALLTLGHDPAKITAFDLDPAWSQHCRDQFPGVKVFTGNFLEAQVFERDVVLQNPPYEGDMHAQFVEHALRCAPVTIAAVPVSIEYGEERDRTLWAQKAQIVRRAKLPVRVKYGGAHSASFDSQVIKVCRRAELRAPGELCAVLEEVWREGE
jgi:predicted RNA methylase